MDCIDIDYIKYTTLNNYCIQGIIMTDEKLTGTKNARDEQNDDSLITFDTPDVSEVASDFIDASENDDDDNILEPKRLEPDSVEDFRGRLDDKGGQFDPAIHDFPARKTPTGKWSKRSKNKPLPEVPDGQDELLTNNAYRAEAEKAGMLYGNLHRVPFGTDGDIKLDELKPLIDDIERYMQQNGHTAIDPKYSVLLSASIYSMQVCQRDNNIDKVRKFFTPVTRFFKKLIGIKEKQKEEVEQHTMHSSVD